MIPASYLFKDVHHRHWGADMLRNGSKAEDAYYASAGGGPIAIARLARRFSDAAASVLASARHRRTPHVPNGVVCRT